MKGKSLEVTVSIRKCIYLLFFMTSYLLLLLRNLKDRDL